MTPSFCPNCGYDLVVEETITLGRATYERHGQFTYAGKPVRLTMTERHLVETLLRAGGQFVEIGAITERLDSDARDPRNIAHVYATRVRNILRPLGAPEGLVACVRGQGLRWAVELENQAEAA